MAELIGALVSNRGGIVHNPIFSDTKVRTLCPVRARLVWFILPVSGVMMITRNWQTTITIVVGLLMARASSASHSIEIQSVGWSVGSMSLSKGVSR